MADHYHVYIDWPRKAGFHTVGENGRPGVRGTRALTPWAYRNRQNADRFARAIQPDPQRFWVKPCNGGESCRGGDPDWPRNDRTTIDEVKEWFAADRERQREADSRSRDRKRAREHYVELLDNLAALAA